jgi:hypothetical protein
MRVEGNMPEDLVNFIVSVKWTYAKTMPVWPHEYLVKQQVEETLFVRLATYIRENGYEGQFYSKPITYYDYDGKVYWTMGAPIEETTIINRCMKEDSYESRQKSGSLPD